MEIREGQFWMRKLSGYWWEVLAINPGGTIAICLVTLAGVDHELLTREEFLDGFTFYE